MEILIVRHGKPKLRSDLTINAKDFNLWITMYNQASLDQGHLPGKNCSFYQSSLSKIQKSNYIICSHLTRSIESAKHLGITQPHKICSQFREWDMPSLDWSYPKLSIKSWALIARVLQLTGYSPQAESYRLFKQRVESCAQELISLAQQHRSVTFIGHGLLNRYIHKQLLKQGWQGPKKPSYQHWELQSYTL